MTFSKNFPRQTKESNYPVWEEIYLSDYEEKEVEQRCRFENIRLMKECIDDAKKLLQEKNLDFTHREVIEVGKALFEKRASHEVYWKESKAKEKFDKEHKKKD